MKRLTILILILIFCGGCFEYMHPPDEITLGAKVDETNFGNRGVAPTTGLYIEMTFYRNDRSK